MNKKGGVNMSDIVKQDEVFGNYYNRINSLILKDKTKCC